MRSRQNNITTDTWERQTKRHNFTTLRKHHLGTSNSYGVSGHRMVMFSFCSLYISIIIIVQFLEEIERLGDMIRISRNGSTLFSMLLVWHLMFT